MATPETQASWRPSTSNDAFNATVFLIQSLLSQVNTATLVRVVAVNGATVDVLPLVDMLDSSGKAVAHTTVYGLPFFQVLGGTAGVVCLPVAGDIGLALFCDRDISSVKATRSPAPPPTRRRFSMSDGVYLGAIYAGAPPATALTLNGSGATITPNLTVQGPVDTEDGGVYKVNGTQVVGPQQPHINPATGGSTVDGQARAVQNQILSALQAHGLLA